MRRQFLTSTTALVLLLGAGQAYAGMDEAKAFLDAEIGDLSTLDRAPTRKPKCSGSSMRRSLSPAWTSRSSPKPSPRMNTNRRCWRQAFTAITGIKITHDLIGEGDVVEKLQTQMQSGENIYDAYVNDSDLIGTHWRYQQARNLTDWMANEGKDVTNPESRPRRLHRHQVHHRAGRQALPAARPAVREPLLVPLRLVQRREEQGRLQGEVRLRPRRAGQLVGL